jgi:hypothetical protein
MKWASAASRANTSTKSDYWSRNEDHEARLSRQRHSFFSFHGYLGTNCAPGTPGNAGNYVASKSVSPELMC